MQNYLEVKEILHFFAETILNNNIMKAKKVTPAILRFFRYSYKGDGKYYTVAQGSRHYNNSMFQNFYNKYPEGIKVVEEGNDAPRGGQTGNYVIVEYTQEFFEIWKEAIAMLEEEKRVIEENLANKEICRQNVLSFIRDNECFIKEKKEELRALKEAGDKEAWQVRANALVCQVCKNDFSLKWREVYNIIINS